MRYTSILAFLLVVLFGAASALDLRAATASDNKPVVEKVVRKIEKSAPANRVESPVAPVNFPNAPLTADTLNMQTNHLPSQTTMVVSDDDAAGMMSIDK
ncbi:MAG: hypothetical protein JWQ98_439 [Chlorobi bacterium]|nr:hypothetical protein [Chlorobiota bacterium]